MINERKMDIAIEQFRTDLKNETLFVVSDLQKAVLTGCNTVTRKQHNEAQAVADEYIRCKDKNLVYTEGDMLKAFEHGARVMSAIVDKESEKAKMQLRIQGQEAYKMAMLTAAAQQMMDLGKQFMEEVEELLRKRNNFRLDTKKNFSRMYKEYTNIRCCLNPIFNNFSAEEGYQWGEDTEILEKAVREIFKIDKVWEGKQLNV